jgi:hypothetical protein
MKKTTAHIEYVECIASFHFDFSPLSYTPSFTTSLHITSLHHDIMSNSDSKTEYIYHEQQEAALCGQHALNNLVQASVFTPGSLANIAIQLDEMELAYMSQNNEGGVRYVNTYL